LRIVLIGPGIMPISSTCLGSVETLIWDYKNELEKMGHDIFIINTPDLNQIISETNSINPDFVHLHYDVFAPVLNYINCKYKAITSHYGYLGYSNKHEDFFLGIYKNMLLQNCYHFALSGEIKNVLIKDNIKSDKIYITPNGVKKELFKYSQLCFRPDKTICLAQLAPRKRQHLIRSIESIDFVGNKHSNYGFEHKNYLGEWSREYLHENLTDYANLILLSDGEAHALVTAEALICGLGLVVSEFAVANLDISKPFIDVIPESKVTDMDYVSLVIEKNRKISITMRDEIRKYGLENFDMKIVVKKYNDIICGCVNKT
jgi:hypothetical protein